MKIPICLALVITALFTGCAVDLEAKSGNKYRFSFTPSVEHLDYFAK